MCVLVSLNEEAYKPGIHVLSENYAPVQPCTTSAITGQVYVHNKLCTLNQALKQSMVYSM